MAQFRHGQFDGRVVVFPFEPPRWTCKHYIYNNLHSFTSELGIRTTKAHLFEDLSLCSYTTALLSSHTQDWEQPNPHVSPLLRS